MHSLMHTSLWLALHTLLIYTTAQEFPGELSRGSHPDDQTGCLLSYPGSGSHWIRFMLEFLVRRKTKGCRENPTDQPLFMNNYGDAENPLLHVDPRLPPIFEKYHYAGLNTISTTHGCSLLDQSWRCPSLLFVLRDYSEVIPRHFQVVQERAEKPKAEDQSPWTDMDMLQGEMHAYLETIQKFVEYQGPKLLLLYEELTDDAVSAVQRLARFLQISDSLITEFVANREELAMTCRSVPGSRSWATRDWGGWRSKNSWSFLSSWTPVQVREFQQKFKELLSKDYDNVVRHVIGGYLESFRSKQIRHWREWQTNSTGGNASRHI